MAYAISDECISCGACAAGCPVNAISEGDGKFVIDPDTCTEFAQLALLLRHNSFVRKLKGEASNALRLFCVLNKMPLALKEAGRILLYIF